MAKQAPVICFYCNKKFHREDEEYETVNMRRYAHKKCSDTVAELQNYLSNVMGQYHNPQKVKNQLNKITKEEYSLEDICEAIRWWYDVKKGDPEKSGGGIGIFSYIYNDYIKYKEHKEKIGNLNKDKQLSDFIDNEPINIIIHRTPIKRPKNFKLFDLS